jgi:hypothetical protein
MLKFGIAGDLGIRQLHRQGFDLGAQALTFPSLIKMAWVRMTPSAW